MCLFYRKGETDSDSNHGSHGPHDPAKAQQEQHQQFLGDASAALPNFGDIDTSVPFPEGITIDHIKSFEKMYREHAEAIVDVVVNLQFSLIEALWQGFWRNQPPDQLTYVRIEALSIYYVNICLFIRAVNSTHINVKIILHLENNLFAGLIMIMRSGYQKRNCIWSAPMSLYSNGSEKQITHFIKH